MLRLKTWQKIVFITVLVIFVAVSVTISLVSISRPPYKFEEISVSEGDVADGWEFYAFNGNNTTDSLSIDYVRDSDGNNPDKTRPVISIRKYAVNADEYIKELFIGPDVRFIDETAFFNVKKLQKITVDPENEWFKDVDGVLYSKDGSKLILYPVCYGEQAGEGEDEFTYPEEYTVPEGVERICTFAFLKNGHLLNVTLPSTLREIGDMAFFDCWQLGKYVYDEQSDSLSGIGFELPDSLEKIGSDAFSKCGSIAPVIYIPSSVKSIGHNAFFNCGGIKDVYIGASDKTQFEAGDRWMPKSIRVGAVWKAPDAKYGATRAQADELIKNYKAETLEKMREESANNG